MKKNNSARNLRLIMSSQNLSSVGLAAKIQGVPQKLANGEKARRIRRLCTGETRISVDDAILLSKYLNTSPEVLLFGEPKDLTEESVSEMRDSEVRYSHCGQARNYDAPYANLIGRTIRLSGLGFTQESK